MPIIKKYVTTPYIGGWLWVLFLGAVWATIVGYTYEDWEFWGWVIGTSLGERTGWGCPIGKALGFSCDKPEWWEKGILIKKPFLALAVRGAMWGIPITVLTLGAAWHSIIALTISMPLSAYLTRWVSVEKDKWGGMEWNRGAITAILLKIGNIYG